MRSRLFALFAAVLVIVAVLTLVTMQAVDATVTTNTTGKGAFSVAFTGAASTSGGGIGAIANPEGQTLIITRATFYFTTPSTGAANLSVGVAADATTSATDILNALAVNGVAEGSAYNGFAMQNTAKTAISAPALWTSTKYITFTGSATTAGLAGTLYIEYLRV